MEKNINKLEFNFNLVILSISILFCLLSIIFILNEDFKNSILNIILGLKQSTNISHFKDKINYFLINIFILSLFFLTFSLSLFNKKILCFIKKMSYFYWFLFTFALTSLFCYIIPTFFSGNLMFFPEYIPVMKPIGSDLEMYVGQFTKAIFLENISPYLKYYCFYPPFTFLFFLPLVFVSQQTAFLIISLLNIFSLFFITVIFPVIMTKNTKNKFLYFFFFIITFFSYGFQFEMERGQFNIIAIALCFFSIYLFHKHEKLKYLAIFIFSISIQLKVYPAIFIFCFIKNPKDFFYNLKTGLALLLINIIMLFSLGPKLSFDFIHKISSVVQEPYIWIGSLSIKVFSKLFENEFHINSIIIYYFFILLFLIIFFINFILMIKKGWNGINPFFFLACSIAAMIIPAVSFDYKLPILTTNIILLFLYFEENQFNNNHKIETILVLIISLFFCITLYSYVYKPFFFITNNFIPLLIILISSTILMFIKSNQKELK